MHYDVLLNKWIEIVIIKVYKWDVIVIYVCLICTCIFIFKTLAYLGLCVCILFINLMIMCYTWVDDATKREISTKIGWGDKIEYKCLYSFLESCVNIIWFPMKREVYLQKV